MSSLHSEVTRVHCVPYVPDHSGALQAWMFAADQPYRRCSGAVPLAITVSCAYLPQVDQNELTTVMCQVQPDIFMRQQYLVIKTRQDGVDMKPL